MRERPATLLEVVLAGAAGLLAGIVIAVVLGAGGGGDTKTTTRVVTARPASPDGTVVARTAVPDLAGQRLDVAQDRVRRAGFIAQVEGGGVLGVIREQNWNVTSQDPAAGQVLQTGSTVRLRIERR